MRLSLIRCFAAYALSLGALGVVAGAVACSSDESKPTPSASDGGSSSGNPDAQGGTDSAPPPDQDADACSSLSAGADVSIQIQHGPLEGTFSGGPIPDGTYTLTGAVVYDGEGDGGVVTTKEKTASALVIKGTSYELAIRSSAQAGSESGTVAYASGSATFTPKCNTSGDLKTSTQKLDVDGAKLVLVQASQSGAEIALRYEKK